MLALMLAGTDGRPVAHLLEDGNVDATAAVSASSLQLGQRLADLLGSTRLEELTVRSPDGYALVYAVGNHWVLTVLTVASANIARINLECRDVCRDLAGLLS